QVPVLIAGMARDGARRFEIRLEPEDLGRVDVRLDIDRDGQVRAHLVVERPEALAALRREAHALQQAFAETGLRSDGTGIQVSLRQGGDGQHHAAYRHAHTELADDPMNRSAEDQSQPGAGTARRLALRSAIDIML
ncbi:MAG TPA: flagellar hook-length control protein FliK, partial [Beijerinckiaceae bacterium]|nr:flagellar hook-length control protein FliK [Beijerinckiaceae bacterium]